MDKLKVTIEIEVPGWVNWIAIDKDGDVYGYENKPKIGKNGDVWAYPDKGGRCSNIYCGIPPKNCKEELYTWG